LLVFHELDYEQQPLQYEHKHGHGTWKLVVGFYGAYWTLPLTLQKGKERRRRKEKGKGKGETEAKAF